MTAPGEGSEREASRDSDADDAGLEPGDRVEVRDRFDRTWAKGFTVEEITPGGYRVRRRSDSMVLPAEFVADEVRRERKSMWWV